MDIHKIQAEARELLAFELAHEVWKLPSKVAERMQAYEARLEMIVGRLVQQARAHLGTTADVTPAAAAVAAPVPAPVDAAAPASSASAPRAEQTPAATAKPATAADDLADEFDTPLF
jgi:hypothetical protein